MGKPLRPHSDYGVVVTGDNAALRRIRKHRMRDASAPDATEVGDRAKAIFARIDAIGQATRFAIRGQGQ